MFSVRMLGSNTLLLLVTLVTTSHEFQPTFAAIISDQSVRMTEINTQEKDFMTGTSEKNLNDLEIITQVHHDQQMDKWSLSKMAAEPPVWPCPTSTAISPCTCTYSASLDYSLEIDCSEATSDTEISSAFSALFPFDDIYNFTIEIDGGSNSISGFTPNMFQSKWFSSIYVVGTELETIDDNVFGLSHDTLETLSLQKNKLTEFPFDVIFEYTKLRYIHLKGNNIKELPELSSNTIHEVNMNNNPELVLMWDERTFIGTPELRTVKLSHTAVSQVPPNLFSSLEHISHIYVSGNGITYLQPAAINAPGPTITQLDLSDNFLAGTILPGSITGLASDAELNLRNNAIVELTEDIWKPIFDQLGTAEEPAVGSIILDKNPLKCGCEINWIIIDDDQWNKVSEGSTCPGGLPVLDVDKNFYLQNCEQPARPNKE